MKYTFSEDSASKDQVYNHLAHCNTMFVPALDSRVNLDDYSEKIMRFAIRFEAWFGTRLVGLVAAYLNDTTRKIAYITNVSVEQAHTGRGLAKHLLQNCIDKAIHLGFEQAQLEVSARNHAALNLYKSLGFTIINESTEYTSKLARTLKTKSNHEAT